MNNNPMNLSKNNLVRFSKIMGDCRSIWVMITNGKIDGLECGKMGFSSAIPMKSLDFDLLIMFYNCEHHCDNFHRIELKENSELIHLMEFLTDSSGDNWIYSNIANKETDWNFLVEQMEEDV